MKAPLFVYFFREIFALVTLWMDMEKGALSYEFGTIGAFGARSGAGGSKLCRAVGSCGFIGDRYHRVAVCDGYSQVAVAVSRVGAGKTKAGALFLYGTTSLLHCRGESVKLLRPSLQLQCPHAAAIDPVSDYAFVYFAGDAGLDAASAA